MNSLTAGLFAISIAACLNSCLCIGKQKNLHFCMDNKTISLQIFAGVDDDDSCKCLTGVSVEPYLRPDYVYEPGIGSYKLFTKAKTWNEARKACEEEGGHLAVINSRAEEEILINMLKNQSAMVKSASNSGQAYLGIHDYFEEGEWITVYGEPLRSIGYVNWSKSWFGVQPDDTTHVQNCGTITKKGGMDDVRCEMRYPYFCELPSICGGLSH